MTLSQIQIGGCFTTPLGNVCQKTGATSITRLFNASGQACPHRFTGRSPSETVFALPAGVNF